MRKKRNGINTKLKILFVIAVLILAGAAILMRNFSNTLSTGVFGFSMNENNSQTCEKLSVTSNRDTCYNVVAVNAKNLSMCDRIEGAWQKDICYSGVKKKISDRNMENP